VDKKFMKNIENVAGVNTNDILKVANSFQNADFSDEKTVRRIIQQVSKLANKPVSKQMEDKLVKAIVSKNVPSMDQIKKGFK
jgi:hypothetical protein